MSNLRRHFNFSNKQSSIGTSASNETENLSLQFDKHNLMNNICSCLDICCSYIQTLNALCGAGSLLAQNLLQTVQSVPAYQNVAQQFLCVWEEVGKATAGASAAVKTETLMVLQEVLNTLEGGNNENNVGSPFTDSFQVIGTCLHSFIELQAQFSMSTWKSLSKLSKNFSNDAFIHSLNWKSHERSALKGLKNSELCHTIKKHYSHILHKYELQKNVETAEVVQSQFVIVPGVVNNPHHSPQTECPTSECTNSSVWSPAATLWSTSAELTNETLSSNPTQINRAQSNQVAAAPPTPQVELDEVINLLSCMPFEQFPSSESHPPQDQSASNVPQSYQFWPQGAGPILPRYQRPWSQDSHNINFGYDSWIWRTDNMNCSDLPVKFNEGGVGENRSSWQPGEFHSGWSGGAGESSSDDTSSNLGHDTDSRSSQGIYPSLRPRRYSSSDNLPELLDNVPDAEDRLLGVQSHKTSTWPLKQPSSRFLSSLNWPDGVSQSKCMPVYYNMPNT